MAIIYYPVETIASLLDLTVRRVQQLVKEGILPKPTERNKYDLVACVRAYVRYLRGGEIESDSHTQKTRLLKARAAKAEIEVQVMSGELLRFEDVEIVWMSVTGSIRSRLLSLPGKAAHAVLPLTTYQETEEELRGFVNELLTELATNDAEQLSDRFRKTDTTGDGTAAEPESKPVGGQVPEAKQ